MTSVPVRTPRGCVIWLLQVSKSMTAESAVQSRRSRRLDDVRRHIDSALEYLARRMDKPGDWAQELDVAVLAFSAASNQDPVLLPLLPDSRPESPLVPLAQLAAIAEKRKDDAHVRYWVDKKEVGRIAGRTRDEVKVSEAVHEAMVIARDWHFCHPMGRPPLILVCMDGSEEANPVAWDRELLEGDTIVAHFLFADAGAGELEAGPENSVPTQWRELWHRSSRIEPSANGACRRALFINTYRRGIIGLLRSFLDGGRRTSSSASGADADSPLPAETQNVPDSTPANEAPAQAAVSAPPPEPPPGPVVARARSLAMPKRGNAENELEDAACCCPTGSVAAVGDGASEGIFTRIWAGMLVAEFIRSRPDLTDPAVMTAWLQSSQTAWYNQIDYPNRRYTQQNKIDQTGAGSTLLTLEIAPGEDKNSLTWKAQAVGDSCLFLVRANQLLESHPLRSSKEFAIGPPLLRTLRTAPLSTAQLRKGTCQPGDLFVLATDAVALSLFQDCEDCQPPDWDSLETVALADWRAHIEELRNAQRIVNDDCTAVVLRVLPPAENLLAVPSL